MAVITIKIFGFLGNDSFETHAPCTFRTHIMGAMHGRVPIIKVSSDIVYIELPHKISLSIHKHEVEALLENWGAGGEPWMYATKSIESHIDELVFSDNVPEPSREKYKQWLRRRIQFHQKNKKS